MRNNYEFSNAKRNPYMTTNIKLIPLSLDHIDGIMSWVNDGEVMKYFAGHQKEISRDEELKYIERLTASPNDKVFSIFADNKYVGQCSVNSIYWPAFNGRLFVVICKEAQGNGYGYQAIEKLLDYAWKELCLHKIWLIVRDENKAAQAMYLRLGFSFEGFLKEEYRVNEVYFDMVRMGMITPLPYMNEVK
jgi:RimJ/RimL family protein N-acetyltransferase